MGLGPVACLYVHFVSHTLVTILMFVFVSIVSRSIVVVCKV